MLKRAKFLWAKSVIALIFYVPFSPKSLDGGFEAWKAAGKEIDTIDTIKADEFEKRYQANSNLNVLDVRKPSEWEAEHIKGSQNFTLDFINNIMHEVKRDNTYYMHCRSGYRSTVAASILKARGFENLINVQDLFATMAASSIPTTEYVCPSTLK